MVQKSMVHKNEKLECYFEKYVKPLCNSTRVLSVKALAVMCTSHILQFRLNIFAFVEYHTLIPIRDKFIDTVVIRFKQVIIFQIHLNKRVAKFSRFLFHYIKFRLNGKLLEKGNCLNRKTTVLTLT